MQQTGSLLKSKLMPGISAGNREQVHRQEEPVQRASSTNGQQRRPVKFSHQDACLYHVQLANEALEKQLCQKNERSKESSKPETADRASRESNPGIFSNWPCGRIHGGACCSFTYIAGTPRDTRDRSGACCKPPPPERACSGLRPDRRGRSGTARPGLLPVAAED